VELTGGAGGARGQGEGKKTGEGDSQGEGMNKMDLKETHRTLVVGGRRRQRVWWQAWGAFSASLEIVDTSGEWGGGVSEKKGQSAKRPIRRKKIL